MTSVTGGQTAIGEPTTIGGPTIGTGGLIPTEEPTAITDEPTSVTGELKQSVYGLSLPATTKNYATAIRVDSIYIPVISKIDVTNNTFDIKVDIDLSWVATNEDIQNYQADSVNFTPSFVPDLVFSNSCSVDTDRIIPEHKILYQMREGNRIYIRHRFIGTLTNRYVIDNFPFDVQSLVFHMTLSYYDKTMAYFDTPKDKIYVYVPTRFTAVPGFDLTRVVAGEVSPDSFSSMLTIIQVERKSGPFFFRIFMPLLAINIASLAIYSLDDISNKIDVLYTTMLSFVGMIYILSTMVPMAGKGMLFDKYAMASIMICAISIFSNSYLHNNTAFLLHVSFEITLHLVFTIQAYRCFRAATKRKEMSLEDLADGCDQFMPLTYPNPK